MTGCRHIILAGLSMALGACALPVRYAKMDKPAYWLTIWADPDPLFNKEDVLWGCNEWLPKGVICRWAESEGAAAVRLTATDGRRCVLNKNGSRPLALAYGSGRIIFNAACFRFTDGTYDRFLFRATVTHEIGHELGIRGHIPEKCDDRAPRHVSGRPICGPAVMNPAFYGRNWFVTEIDALAFDVLDLSDSVLVPIGDHGSRPPSDRPVK